MALAAVDTQRRVLVRRGFERRSIVLVAAAVLFVGIFVLRQLSNGAETGLALLYVFPIVLVALELGFAAGLIAALVASGLLVIWTATTDAELGAIGVLTRTAVFAAAGAVAGRFSDRLRSAYLAQGRLIDASLELTRLEGAGDLARLIARGALALPTVGGARVTLGAEAPVELGKLGPNPARYPLTPRDDVEGLLEVELRDGLEGRAVMAIFALQASVALENRRLLEGERERIRLQLEVQEAQAKLAARGAQLRTILDSQERERTQLAYELHEEAAQTLTTVLLGLGVLEGELTSGPSAKRLAELRGYVDSTLSSVQQLAVSMRPPVLDGIGLIPALERLADGAAQSGLRGIDLSLDPIRERLSPEAETAVYRTVEDAIGADEGPREAEVDYDEETGELRVSVRLLDGGTAAMPTSLHARVDLLGGTVTREGRLLEARLPLP